VNLRDSMLAVLVALVWGVNFVVIDEGLQGVPPLLFVALRFTVVLVPAIFLVRRPAVPWRVIIGVGLLTCVGQFGLLYLALHLGMPAGIASLVLQAQVMFTVLFAGLALRERPSRRQLIGIVVGAIGLVVVGAGRSAGTPLVAVLLTLAAAVAWALGNVVTRKAGVRSGLSLTVWAALVVPVPMFGLSLLVDGPAAVGHGLTHLPVGALASTAYTAWLSTLLGYGIYNTLLARYPASSVVPFTLLVPAAGMLTAWIWQGEVPNPAELAGAGVVLTGVAVTAIAWRRRRRAEPVGAEVSSGR
jgi:O-acetylserine/cysteine efflux transporter